MNQAAPLSREGAHGTSPVDGPARALVELFFFAYRDLVGDADRVLAAYGFGRAHHRVLHFVESRGGLTVAELLDLLRITKQSLNRVLKELIEKGFVESRVGAADRRQRLLFTTATGRALALELAELQVKRVGRALGPRPEETAPAVAGFLRAMRDHPDEDGARKAAGMERAR